MATIACPACGAANRQAAATCRMCGGVLNISVAAKPSIQRKLLRRTDFLAAAQANVRNTRRLVVALLTIGGALGYLIGWNAELAMTDAWYRNETIWYLSGWGVSGALALIGFGAIWSLITFKYGDRIILGITGAQEVSRDQEPQLHNVVEEMAIAAGLPKPRVFVIETPAMNAFATGLRTDRAAIGVTRGLLERLTRDELQGVIGHEMGHIVNLDMRYATAVGVMVGLIALVADEGWRMVRVGARGRHSDAKGAGPAVAAIILVVFALLAPLFAKLVQMAVSRQREFLADATSVRLTRNPLGLISALEKLEREATPFDGVNRATQHLFIVNPLKRFSERSSALMATHPPLPARIQRLQNLGA